MNSVGRPWLWMILLCLSGGLAVLFRWAEVPAALLLGPMVAAMGFALFGARIRMPRWSLVPRRSSAVWWPAW